MYDPIDSRGRSELQRVIKSQCSADALRPVPNAKSRRRRRRRSRRQAGPPACRLVIIRGCSGNFATPRIASIHIPAPVLWKPARAFLAPSSGARGPVQSSTPRIVFHLSLHPRLSPPVYITKPSSPEIRNFGVIAHTPSNQPPVLNGSCRTRRRTATTAAEVGESIRGRLRPSQPRTCSVAASSTRGGTSRSE